MIGSVFESGGRFVDNVFQSNDYCPGLKECGFLYLQAAIESVRSKNTACCQFFVNNNNNYFKDKFRLVS